MVWCGVNVVWWDFNEVRCGDMMRDEGRLVVGSVEGRWQGNMSNEVG